MNLLDLTFNFNKTINYYIVFISHRRSKKKIFKKLKLFTDLNLIYIILDCDIIPSLISTWHCNIVSWIFSETINLLKAKVETCELEIKIIVNFKLKHHHEYLKCCVSVYSWLYRAVIWEFFKYVAFLDVFNIDFWQF